MSILAGILGQKEKRYDLLEVSKMFVEARNNESTIEVSADSALRMTAVFSAVALLAETIGSLPLILYQRAGNNRQRAVDHYLYPILHDSPNEMMTAVEFRSTIQGYLALRGNAISQIEYDERGRVRELWPLRWEAVHETRVERQTGRIFYYYLNPDGKFQWLTSDNIWHLRGWGSDGIVGYSPIAMARRAVKLGLAAEEFGARFFENDARPGIVLEHPGKLSDTAHKHLKEEQETEHKGVSKSHRVQILEEGLKLHEIGIPPEDAQFLETRKFQVTEIARIFRVPPHMIGDLERATFSNIEHQGIEFVTYSLQSWLTRWEQSISRKLLLPSERAQYYAEHLVDGLLRGDTLARYQAYQTGINSGWFTRADAREKENLKPIAGLEKPLVPLNMIEVGAPTPAQAQASLRSAEPEERAKNFAGRRHRLMLSYRKLYADTAARVLRREKNDVGALAQKTLGKQDLPGFLAQMDAFYREHVGWVIRQMKPLTMVYGQQVAGEAAGEVDSEPKEDDIDQFTQSYVGGYGARHVGISQDRLKARIDAARMDGLDPYEAVSEELDSWPDVRAGQIADEESVRFNNAMAKTVYMLAGRTLLRSVAFGKNCPYCDALNGKVVGINEWFISAGEAFQPEGTERPLTSTTNLGHAPYHGGCDCMVVAG